MKAWPRLRDFVADLAVAPGWIRLGLILVFGAAQIGLCWCLFLLDLQQTLSQQGPLQELAQARIAERLVETRRGEGGAVQARAEQEQLAELEGLLAKTPGAQAAWASVHQASQQHGLRMENFKPGPVGSEQPYAEQRASVRLSGNFQNLLGFTRTLAEGNRSVAIESYSLSGGQTGQVGQVGQASQSVGGGGSLVLEAVFLCLHPPERAIPAALVPSAVPSLNAAVDGQGGQLSVQKGLQSAAADPFEGQRLAGLLPSSNTAAASVRALQVAPLSSMRMVGSVRQAERMAALLMINGTLHAVRVGDVLGSAHGQVMEIGPDQLTVREPSTPGQGSARAVVLTLSKD